MAGKLNLLTARQVETISQAGRHADGGGLYLRVRPGGSKTWSMMFAVMDGKRRKQTEISLGPAGAGGLSLAEARGKAAEIRAQRLRGLDPKAERKAAAVPTFGIFADEYIDTHASRFKSPKHLAQWRMTLGDTYCGAIRGKLVSEIGTDDVLAVLKPIWGTVPETASRIRGRLENVLDAAKARGFRAGENPATWRGHLRAILPARQKLTRGHHAALPYDDVPAFMAALRARQSLAAMALELAILTACRSGEVLGARWEEIDLKKGVWIIPKERMKAGLAHRVPLSKRAVALLKGLPQVNPYVFPGQAPGKPLSGMAMEMQLRRMDRNDITVHGFRSTFRDWSSEQTSFPHETCEHALAHRISDKAEAAYRRGDQFEKRRELMQAWARWCEPKLGSNVVQLKK
ncbi:MAG: integrase arm-type DNA-binding domain-containing protein [Aestuariivirga sp.]|uniref:tyrosine-type recombinase/integrase n=1 Tax=Aestuariivirga sp. TaxID=2650926 RepID=UPI003019290B